MEKIMIVDDDEEFLEELREALALGDYDTLAIDNPTVAFNAARVTRPTVILLSLRMHGMNGFLVAEKLRRSPETAHIPIIAITGHFTGEEHHALMKAYGITTCLRKPLDPQDVIARIELEIKKKKAKKILKEERLQ